VPHPRAGASKKVHTTKVASLAELEVMVGAMPFRYRAMVLLAAWCGLRFGELAELRRGDVDLEARTVRVERAVTSRDGQVFVGDPKSQAGKHTVSLPPHLVPVLEEHLCGTGPDGALLFPAHRGGHLAATTLHPHWKTAREAAGRPDLRFHDLRHTGATLTDTAGVLEAAKRLGHARTSVTTRHYARPVEGRDRDVADRLSALRPETPRHATTSPPLWHANGTTAAPRPPPEGLHPLRTGLTPSAGTSGAADCKSAGSAYEGSNPSPTTPPVERPLTCEKGQGSSSTGLASALLDRQRVKRHGTRGL